jgi:uncharacterized membrane protein
MSKLFSSAIPVALTLAASLFCATAHADQPAADASQQQVSVAQTQPSDAANQQAHGLTRKQVYAQLVEAEQDGTLARLNATVYKGN